MERVERMHWHLLVERLWSPETSTLADSETPQTGTAKQRAQFTVARRKAREALDSFFPPDEE